MLASSAAEQSHRPAAVRRGPRLLVAALENTRLTALAATGLILDQAAVAAILHNLLVFRSGRLKGAVARGVGRRRPVRRLTHRFSISYRIPGSAAKRVSFVGVPTTVGQRRAVRVAPPLRGSGWVDFNGCCATITSYRDAIEPINGTL